MSGNNGREQWGSRIGFILAAAGSAVGLGNIWKFPYLTGANGGGAFVVVYILVIMLIGFTTMMAEFAIGRRAQLNAIDSFKKLKGGAWPLVGWMGIVCGVVILSYYCVIGGWTIKYFIYSFTGLMSHATAGNAAQAFGDFTGNSASVIFYQLLFVLLTTWVVYKGVGEGIERSCKFLMPTLFLILFVLIGRSLTLEGAGAGVAFYLVPDFSKLTMSTCLAAVGQAFFSLSLGMGIMITYGSYLDKETNLAKSAVQVCFIDTMVAFLAGMVIFPAVFAFGVEPGAGPGLTFITLPSVFAMMPGGPIWSAIFFVLLFLAAITSSMSLLEGSVAYCIDKGLVRTKATVIMATVVFLLGVPSSISLAGGLDIFGKSFFDAACYLTDALLMPLGGVAVCFFAGWVIRDQIKDEVTNGGTLEFPQYDTWMLLVKYVAPLGILWIFVTGLKW